MKERATLFYHLHQQELLNSKTWVRTRLSRSTTTSDSSGTSRRGNRDGAASDLSVKLRSVCDNESSVHFFWFHVADPCHSQLQTTGRLYYWSSPSQHSSSIGSSEQLSSAARPTQFSGSQSISPLTERASDGAGTTGRQATTPIFCFGKNSEWVQMTTRDQRSKSTRHLVPVTTPNIVHEQNVFETMSTKKSSREGVSPCWQDWNTHRHAYIALSARSVRFPSITRMLRIKSVWSHKCSLFINAYLII